MTACDVWTEGFGDGEFDWEHAGTYKTAATSSSPVFPHIWGHYHERFHKWVKTTEVPSEKVDWGTWVAAVSKAQIEEFLEYAYGDDDRYYGSGASEGFVESMAKLRSFVDALDPDKKYALIASES